MECRIQFCATPERTARFLKRSEKITDRKMSRKVERSRVVGEPAAEFLRRRWDQTNDRAVHGAPELTSLELAFADSSGFLTPARLESLSRDLQSALDTVAESGEAVAWILTLTTEPDRTARDDIARRHPSLDWTSDVTMAV